MAGLQLPFLDLEVGAGPIQAGMAPQAGEELQDRACPRAWAHLLGPHRSPRPTRLGAASTHIQLGGKRDTQAGRPLPHCLTSATPPRPSAEGKHGALPPTPDTTQKAPRGSARCWPALSSPALDRGGPRVNVQERSPCYLAWVLSTPCPAAEVLCARVSTLVCETAVHVSRVLPTLQGSCPWAASPACRNPLCAVGPVQGPA